MVSTPPNAAWSPDAYRELVRRGRWFAESVLIHLERLEKLDASCDPRDLEDANIRLEAALLDFQNAQVAYAGSGFGFIDDQSESQDEDEPQDARAAGPDQTAEPSPEGSVVALGDVVSVMSRHDFALVDQGAVEATAQQFAEMAGATPVPPGDLGYAMAILNYIGLGQLTATPGLRPLLEVNAVSTRDGSPTREELAGHEDLSALFDPGVVLNHQENFWDAATEA